MAFYKALRSVVMYLNICDGNMQEGSMRADLNLSVRKKGESRLGTRSEVKNLNSIRFLGQAVEFEFRRQVLELEEGRAIVQETRLWDSLNKETRSMRSKEDAHDYRYFPDPDLKPLILDKKRIQHIAHNLPELGSAKKKRFVEVLGLSDYDAGVLVSEKALADYFESALEKHNNAKSMANWIINDLLREVKTISNDDDDLNLENFLPSAHLSELVKLIDTKVITGKIAKDVFAWMMQDKTATPKSLVEKHGLVVERNEDQLNAMVQTVLDAHPDEIARYRSGKTQLFGFFVGQVMRQSKGKADPELINALLNEKLKG
jgi:aspartyl-tRNA(Asn)/glutamyl-tRNA(Gln) amidotransferase subunit B